MQLLEQHRSDGRARRRARRARRQEGAVLLVVLMVIFMLMGLGSYVAYSASYESRSVRAGRQLQRLRRAANAAVMGAASYVAQMHVPPNGLTAPADTRWTGPNNWAYRSTYGLPAYSNDLNLLQVTSDQLAAPTYYPLGATGNLPGDAQISDGASTPFQFSSMALIETYQMPAAAGNGIGSNGTGSNGLATYRLCITSYTHMALPSGTDSTRAGDTRALHESIGISRGYFEVR